MAAIDIKPPVDRYKAIADAIREKNGTTELMHPADMPQAILDIVGDGDVIIGADYTNIVYNEDDTITLTDKDGVEHTMSCTYADGKLIDVIYDGKAVNLTYSGDRLVKVGKTAVDMANAQTSGGELLDHTVTFTVEGEPYEVVSVKDGNSVNAPSVEPTSVNGFFAGWQTSGELVGFPYTPTEDVDLIANFDAKYYSNKLYEHFGVSPTEYPIVVVEYSPNTKNLWVIFDTSITERTDDLLVPYPSLKTGSKTVDIGDITTENAVNSCIAKIDSVSVQTSGRGLYGNNNEHYWINKALTKTYENLNIHYF